jgi:hypothetical protein
MLFLRMVICTLTSRRCGQLFMESFLVFSLVSWTIVKAYALREGQRLEQFLMGSSHALHQRTHDRVANQPCIVTTGGL